MDYKKIALNIKQLRTSLGLSQKAFGEKIGLQWHRIKDVEIGKIKASLELVSKISNAYNISIAELTGEVSATDSATGTDTMQVEKSTVTLNEPHAQYSVDIDQQLLDAFHRLSDENKRMLVKLLESLTESQKKNDLFIPIDGSKKKTELLVVL